VRETLTERTIRYYTTLGLVDPPAEKRGLRAMYGRRHLLQLLAIKRLQTEGLTLQEIQERLQALTNARLEQIARVPEGIGADRGREAEAPSSGRSRRATRFWATPPDVRPAQEGPGQRSPALAEEHQAVLRAPTTPYEHVSAVEEGLLQGVPLASAVTLLIATAQRLSRADVEALRSAATPLLDLIRRRGLVSADPRGDS
jgi:DNA-binding transcriptional MerR regulator